MIPSCPAPIAGEVVKLLMYVIPGTLGPIAAFGAGASGKFHVPQCYKGKFPGGESAVYTDTDTRAPLTGLDISLDVPQYAVDYCRNALARHSVIVTRTGEYCKFHIQNKICNLSEILTMVASRLEKVPAYCMYLANLPVKDGYPIMCGSDCLNYNNLFYNDAKDLVEFLNQHI
jgi:hypothetical protein